MASLGDLVINLSANSRPLTSGLGSAQRSVRGFSGSAIASMGKLAAAVGAVGLAYKGIKTIISGIGLAADAETTAVSFRVILRDAELAKQTISELRELAKTTPLQEDDILGAGKSLLAFGVDAKDLQKELRMIGDIASGLSIPLGDLAEIYGKAKVQGRLFAEDINQLTGRGIPVIQEFAKQLGVAESEVKQMVEQGKIGFPQLQQAFQDMTGEGGAFNDMLGQQSKTMNGMLSTLKDTWNATLREIGQVIIEEIDLKSLIEDVGELIKMVAGPLADAFRVVFKVVKTMFSIIKEIANQVLRVVETAAEVLTLGAYKDAEERAEERRIKVLSSEEYNATKRLLDELGFDGQRFLDQKNFREETIPLKYYDVPRDPVVKSAKAASSTGVGEMFAMSLGEQAAVSFVDAGNDFLSAAEQINKAAVKWEANSSTQVGSREAMEAILRQTRGGNDASFKQKQLAAAQKTAQATDATRAASKEASLKLSSIEMILRRNGNQVAEIP